MKRLISRLNYNVVSHLEAFIAGGCVIGAVNLFGKGDYKYSIAAGAVAILSGIDAYRHNKYYNKILK